MNKTKDKTQEEMLKVLENIDALVENHNKAGRLYPQLKGALMRDHTGTVISWTPDKFITLLSAYFNAVEGGRKEFVFTDKNGGEEGEDRYHNFITSYAKYLIEYLEPMFAKPDNQGSHVWNSHGYRVAMKRKEHLRRMKAEGGE